MRQLLYVGAALFSMHAYAAPNSVKVDSLTPQNKDYLNAFCNFHPQSGLCYFTPNPVPKPPLTPPGQPVEPGPVNPGPIGGGGPGIPLCYITPGKTVQINGSGQLQAALNAATPGTQILVAAGTYGGNFTYNKNASAASPIIIAAAAQGAVTFTGTFNFGGSYGVIKGMRFTGAGTKISLSGNHNRITRNQFTNTNADGAISLDGAHYQDRIDHNEFRNFVGAAVRGNIKSAIPHQGHNIDHNYFSGHTIKGVNESVMLLLTDAYRDSFLTYEYNLIENALHGASNQSEIITTKTAKTTLRGNTIIRTNGDITFRETNRSLAEANCFKDGAGMKVFGDDNIVRGNYLTGGGKIAIHGGDGTMDMTQPGCKKTGQTALLPGCVVAHTTARRALVENNIGPIVVGYHYPNDNIPAQNTVLKNNSGPISYVNHTGTTKTDGTPVNNTKCLTPGNVGLSVPDASCTGN